MASEMTVDRLRERIARSMGWCRPEDWPSQIEPVEIANEAGEWLYSLEDWNSLARPLAELSLVADQGWIDLPADFGRMVGDRITTQTGFGHRIALGTMDEVREARSSAPGGIAFVGCIVHTGPALAGPRSLARLDIGPVPTQSAASAFLIAYQAGWKEVSDGSDHILVPSWMQSVYVAAATAFVGGREHEEDGSVEDRLDRLVASSLMVALRNRDLSIQTSFGELRGGVGEMLDTERVPVTSRFDVTIAGGSAG